MWGGGGGGGGPSAPPPLDPPLRCWFDKRFSGRNDRLEEDRGDHEMEAAREDDNEGHEGEDDVNDP